MSTLHLRISVRSLCKQSVDQESIEISVRRCLSRMLSFCIRAQEANHSLLLKEEFPRGQKTSILAIYKFLPPISMNSAVTLNFTFAVLEFVVTTRTHLWTWLSMNWVRLSERS